MVYTGLLKSGQYDIILNTNHTADAEVDIEYSGIIMSAGSTSTQKYATGIDNWEIGQDSYLLNTFNSSVFVVDGFKDCGIYNNSFLCCANYPTNTNATQAGLGRYTSRTDKFNKAYISSDVEGWQTILSGTQNTFKSVFSLRYGDKSGFDWTNNDLRQDLVPL